MIKFAQKQYSEYDAMRALYVELMKYSNRTKFEVIDRSALIPILKGNNVVIERFVISTQPFGRDKYRMYIKVGAKAKLPDEVRLATRTVYDKKLLDFSISFKGGPKSDKGGSEASVKTPYMSINHEVSELLGNALRYDKQERSLVLEFKTIQNAIEALNVLPFGLDYRIKLLDS